MRPWIPLVALLWLGCSDKDDEPGTDDGTTDDGSGSDSGAPVECEEVPPDDCADTPGCSPLSALPVTTDAGGDMCVDYTVERTALGCISADAGCGAAETPATTADAPDTCLWLFPSTCLPPDFMACTETYMPECG